MKIENIITISQFSHAFQAWCESTVWLQRPYVLTEAGAQRIIRKTKPDAFVVRVETMLRA
jgi:alpha-N-acetylglucosamine transferase